MAMIMSYWLLVLLPIFTESFTFPGPDDDPILAVIDFKNKMHILNPSLGEDAPVETIQLSGPRGGASDAVDYDYKNNMVYWTNVFSGRVYRFNASDPSTQVMVNPGEIYRSPEGLAYDWIHGNLYVTNWREGELVVVNTTTGARKTLVQINGTRDVEVDPINGWLYFVTGWDQTAKLWKSPLNGENPVILTEDMDRPISIALDHTEQRIYWCEAYPVKKIYSIGVNGEDQRLIYTYERRYYKSPRYITIAGDYMYWTQAYRERVLGRKKNNGNRNIRFRNAETYGRWDIQKDVYMGIVAIDPGKQREGVNLCGDNNGGCEYFCLPTMIGQSPPFTCVCPDDVDCTQDQQ